MPRKYISAYDTRRLASLNVLASKQILQVVESRRLSLEHEGLLVSSLKCMQEVTRALQ